MARIRSVHPGLFTDEAFVSVSPLARLLAIGIWTEADDHGVFSWKPLTLKMRLLPADAADVTSLLEELVQARLVARFSVAEHEYGAVRNFCKWQRPKKPRFSGPLPHELEEFVGLSGTDAEGVPPQPPLGGEAVPHEGGTGGENSAQMERRGEKEGREGKYAGADAPAPLPPDPTPSSGASSPARDAVFREGVPIIRALTGRPDAAARSLLGKLLKISRDDCARVLVILQDAKNLRPADPAAWLIGAAQQRAGPPRASKTAWTYELAKPVIDMEAAA